MSALFNLGILSVVTFYQMAMEGKITPSTSVSTGFAFVTLFLIVVHLATK